MKLKNPKDFWSGIMFAAIGISFAVIVKAYEYPMGTGARMGPGYFPFVLGIVMGILALRLRPTLGYFVTLSAPCAGQPRCKPWHAQP